MSPEFIAIIAMGVSIMGLIIGLHLRMERRADRQDARIDRLEDDLNRRIDRLEENHNRRFEQLDARLRTVEQNQAHLAGELASIRELLRLQPVGLD